VDSLERWRIHGASNWTTLLGMVSGDERVPLGTSTRAPQEEEEEEKTVQAELAQWD